MWMNAFKKLGLSKAEFVRGSEFQFNREYIEDVLSVAQQSTLNRALRSMQEVARDIENAHTSQVIYPLMQAVDIKHLGVDVAYGGMEQRKIHMLAREMLPLIGYRKPVCIHTPLLPSIQGPDVKMSSSKPETMIAVDEKPDDIKKKIAGAFCPPETTGNPVLSIAKLVLFPRLGKIAIKRPQKFGGDAAYESYEKLEADYASKKLHPQDLKNAVSEELAQVFEKAR
jgi:tyrosyl-tRNA synthetase